MPVSAPDGYVAVISAVCRRCKRSIEMEFTGVFYGDGFTCRPCRQVEQDEVDRRADLDAYRSGGVPSEHSGSTLGAMSELRVCADLIGRGFHVFRSQSPNCPCDLIAMMSGVCYRVEVKTGRTTSVGTISYPAPVCHTRYDILAVALREGRVAYFPDIYPTGSVGRLSRLPID